VKKTQQGKDYFIFDTLKETLNYFPNDTEREHFIKNIDEIIKYLQSLKEKVQSLPKDEELSKVLLSIGDITNFLQSAEKNPSLAVALGLAYEKKMKAKPKREAASSQSIEPLLKELKSLPTEEIQNRLNDYKSITMAQLHGLASLLGIKYEQRIKRVDLVDKIVKIGFANIRGYDLMRSEKRET
jgi:hypothetical protein